MSHDPHTPARASLSRRGFLGTALAAGTAAVTANALSPLEAAAAVARDRAGTPPATLAPFELDEVTVAELQQGMASGKYTARAIAERYLARIAEIDRKGPAINSVIELNPEALEIADGLDAERRAGKVRGPLHGIPVLLKDNVATRDRMQTTAGSLALVGSTVPRDAFIVRRLRAAGAVILGKTNLSEWANFRSTHSSSGWSARGGLTHNAYALDRTPSGSSSGTGSAIAANLCAIGIGTETDGSITSPAATSSLVGIKPTIGLVSRSGIVPIAHSQDTAGPMTRTVADAAVLLSAIAGPDPLDDATVPRRPEDFTKYLDANGLEGARIGIARERYMGYNSAVDKLVDAAIEVMKERGAIIVDPANVATAGKFDDTEWEVLLWEFKADLGAYLRNLIDARVRSLADVIEFNDAHAEEELPYFGQEIMVMSQKKGPLTSAAYRKALAHNRLKAATEGIDATMKKHRLDALVAPTQGPAWLIDLVNGDSSGGGSFTSPAAVAGYPHVTVPAGFVRGLPIGISFVGRAWSEATLIKLAYAYEQATKHRLPPRFLPTVDLSRNPQQNTSK